MPSIQTFIKPVLLLGFFCLSAIAQAETLSIINEPENSSAGIQRPVRGMTMQQVESNYGSPIDTSPAVGEPPITRWGYDKFTVYFEHQHVIHAVAHRK